MQQLNNIAQKNAASSEELEANSEELNKMVDNLNQQIGYFKM